MTADSSRKGHLFVGREKAILMRSSLKGGALCNPKIPLLGNSLRIMPSGVGVLIHFGLTSIIGRHPQLSFVGVFLKKIPVF